MDVFGGNFDAAFDALARGQFGGVGLALAGTYTAQGSNPVPCTGYIDRDVQVVGEVSETTAVRTVIRLFKDQVPVQQSGAVVTFGSESFTLETRSVDDGSSIAWIVL